MAVHIVITSQFGMLSRGRHSARKILDGGAVKWANRNEQGCLVITEPGVWHLHTTDGFRRVARAALNVKEDGDWTMHGDVRQFTVLES